MKVLHVCANPKPTEESASKQLAAAFFGKLISLNSDIEVLNNDLYNNPPPFYSFDQYRGVWYPIFVEGYNATDKEKEANAYADEMARQFCDCDVVVFTCPMWNFGAPSILKAYLDQIMCPERTFTLTEGGAPIPLHQVKKAVLLSASGGTYTEGDELDALTPSIRAPMSFLGIEDSRVAWADGPNTLLFADIADRQFMAI